MYLVSSRRRNVSTVADKAKFGFFTISTFMAAGYYESAPDGPLWHFAATMVFITLGSILSLKAGKTVVFGD